MATVPDPFPDIEPPDDSDLSAVSSIPVVMPTDGPEISAPVEDVSTPGEELPDIEEGGENGVESPDVVPD